jgi:hypothetical protein
MVHLTLYKEILARIRFCCGAVPHRRVTTTFRVTIGCVALLILTGVTVNYRGQMVSVIFYSQFFVLDMIQ